ncbi:Predicted Zn-dependent peptidase [Sphingopyxis sp. YR583]|uniref:M16 family metallopeptidase n=1 Tax=Sphingopyxis sp. YR583 TaxID=1881047 RepID=UPI0008A74603|nr:pitrilysin family protein [Sphingopyxis sp. YR583]SEH13017.1 Predicted Zn-dependent peptidase [Sphingopyxis sp. YR583]
MTLFKPFAAALLASVALTAIPAADAKPAGAKAGSTAVSAADPLAGLEVDIPAKRFVLKNGLTLIVHEDKSAPLVAVNIWYHVGSKNEPAGKSGFAHLFEHLMFNGSEHFNDDFFKATEKIGASDQNGTTDNDRTNYFQTVPKAALDSILWLESDRMGHLLGAIDQAKLDEQRAVVKNEKRRGENNPYSKAQDLIIKGTTPPDHPYGHSVIGSMEDLDNASLDDVKQWFRDYYGPSNAVLVLAGDITPAEALAKVEKYFGDIEPGTPVSQPTSWVVKKTGTVRETTYVRAAQPVFIRTWNISDYKSADTDYLQFFAQTFGGSRTTPLVKRLVIDEQLATEADASVSNREIGGQFSISVTAKPGVDLAKIEKIVDEELKKAIASGPSASEMGKVRTQNIAGLVKGLEAIGGFGGKANLLAESETYLGSPDAWKTGWDRFRKATPADLQGAAKRWLSDGDYVLHMVPFGQLSASAEGADRTKMPEPGAAVPAVFPAVERAELANGLKLVVARRTGIPVVNMSLLVNTGVAADWQRETKGANGFAAGLMDQGTKTRTGDQLSDQLGALGASVSSGGGGESSVVSLSAMKPTLGKALDIYADVVLNPAYRIEDVERAKSNALAGLAASKQDGAKAAGRLAGSILHGADSPYGQLVEEADIAAIDPAKLTAFHDRWFKPNNATLVVSGDTSLAEIRPLVEAAFGKWQRGSVPERIVPLTPPATKSIVYLIDKPGAPQSAITASVIAPRRVEGDNAARGAFISAIGGSFTSRINMKLREEKGWAYGASAGIGGGRGSRTYSASATVQTDKTAESMTEIANLLKGAVTDKKMTAKELADAKANMSLGLSSQWSKTAGIAGAVIDQISYDLPQDYYATYPQAIDAVTLEAANAAGAQILAGKPLTWIIAGDLKKIEAGVRALNIGEVRVIDADGKVIR